MNKKKFITLIKGKRNILGLSSRSFAKMLGKTPAAVSHFESGAGISYDTLVKIVESLNLNCKDEALAAYGYIPKDVVIKLLNNVKLYEKIRNNDL